MFPRVEITAADIAHARRVWELAATADAPQERIDQLRADYVRLISTQAQQIADDFRRENRAS
jgi:hypothetical protein